ncbi:MAG: hypothetical protein FWH12_00300 [Treponema sp.]|nr:hypothetical protein [Treponema sp.]
MKLMFCLPLLLFCSSLFAADARVLPVRTGRFYLEPAYTFVFQRFNQDEEREQIDHMRVFNLGLALEYGIFRNVTASVLWLPGVNMWSRLDSNYGSSQAEIASTGDLFAGARIQIAGREGPIKSEVFRLTFTPGVRIPLPGPDFQEQGERLERGESVTIVNLDRHVLGFGLGSYLDILVHDNFFFSFNGEILYFPIRGEVSRAGLAEYQAIQGAMENLPPGSSLEAQINYGYLFSFKLKPVFTRPLTQGMLLGAGLPVLYRMSPGKRYDFTGTGPGTEIEVKQLQESFPNEGPTHVVSFVPHLSLFFHDWLMPLEIMLSYQTPIWGKNSDAGHVISMRIMGQFRF